MYLMLFLYITNKPQRNIGRDLAKPNDYMVFSVLHEVKLHNKYDPTWFLTHIRFPSHLLLDNIFALAMGKKRIGISKIPFLIGTYLH